MIELYRFLASYEALIYIVLAIGGLFVARWLWRSWSEWRQAAYSLEREFSQRRLSQSGALLALILLLFCGEFFLASFVIPGLPAEVFLSTPTLDLLEPPSGQPPSVAGTAVDRTATVPNTDSSGCEPGRVALTAPESGAEISGVIELTGTADIPNFGFYKYEVAPRDSDTWATISAGREVVRNGTLGRWDTTALTPGDYLVRLVVTDNAGQAQPPCVIALRVAGPE